MQDQDLVSGNRQCFSLGPFHSSENRDEVLARLQDVSASISERQTQALVEKGYWVYLPPYISLLEANRVLLSLQSLGLEDVRTIYDGEWKNAISLGYFLRQKNAVRRQKGLKERGYEPLVRVRRKTEPRYWLDYEQDPGSELITLDMQNRAEDFMQRSLPCPEQDVFDIVVGTSRVTADDITQAQVPEDNVEAVPDENYQNEPETGTEIKID